VERIRPGVGNGDPGEQATLEMEPKIAAPKKTRTTKKPSSQTRARTKAKPSKAAKTAKAASKKTRTPRVAPAARLPRGAKSSQPSRAKTSSKVTEKSAALLKLALRSLDDDKALDVATILLAGKTTIADHMVVASGRSQRQVGAMAQHLAERMKAAGYRGVQIEGMPQCDWVLVDAGDVIVHLFRPEVRTFYNLEKMWAAEFDESAADSPPAAERAVV